MACTSISSSVLCKQPLLPQAHRSHGGEGCRCSPSCEKSSVLMRILTVGGLALRNQPSTLAPRSSSVSARVSLWSVSLLSSSLMYCPPLRDTGSPCEMSRHSEPSTSLFKAISSPRCSGSSYHKAQDDDDVLKMLKYPSWLKNWTQVRSQQKEEKFRFEECRLSSSPKRHSSTHGM